ncbi:MAG: 30S ribosomal protein S2, partial [Gammaproteobacteria bacterium]
IDVDHERIAVSEAKKLGIPVVGVCDTNSSPDGIDYPIPGNDDAIRAIRLYLRGAADAILQARAASAQTIEGDADDYVEVTEELAAVGQPSTTVTEEPANESPAPAADSDEPAPAGTPA